MIVAFSGGGDSVCLLHQLEALKSGRGVLAVHVDHGLDHGSAGRACRARQLAADMGLDCLIERVQVRRSGSLEANARHARYEALVRHIPTQGTLVTAHHADDVAETMLLRLLRGAGPGGLAGIPRRRRLGPGLLVRPLLDWRRADILAYLEQHQLDWIKDPANDLLALDRNYIRHEVLPIITSRFPGAVSGMNRSASLNRSALVSLNALAAGDLAAAKMPGGRLSTTVMASLDAFRRSELLRRWCLEQGQRPPPGARMDEFLRQVDQSSGGSQPELRWAEARVRFWREALWMENLGEQADVPWSLLWDGSTPLELPPPSGRLFLSGQGQLPGPWLVCSGRSGEKLKLPGRRRRRVKDLLYECGAPPWQRERWPRLYRGERLLAVGSEWLDEQFERDLKAAGLQLHWETSLVRRAPGLQ